MCVSEFPRLKTIYEAYKSRGLEIINLNLENMEGHLTPKEYAQANSNAQEVVRRHACSWPQATQESIEELVLTGFTPIGLPASILLDGEGKIVATGTNALPGYGLQKTIESLLGK